MANNEKRVDLNSIAKYARKISEYLAGFDQITVEICSDGFDICYDEDDVYNDGDNEDLSDIDGDYPSSFGIVVDEVFKNVCEDFGKFNTYDAKCKDCYRQSPSLNGLCEIEKFCHGLL